MDMIMIDVTDVGGVQEGEEVILLGRQGDQAFSADEWAARLGTISYEILCNISKRVPRTYLWQGKILGA
jgi:alanine racemase